MVMWDDGVDIQCIIVLPVIGEINARLWTSRAKDGYGSILSILLLR
jgi:hypothetical protein